MGPVCEGVVCPHADPLDPDTTIAGVRKRFATKPPDADPKLVAGLREFVKSWLVENLKPLSPDVDTSVETWLESTSYPQWRKDELRAVWEKGGDPFDDFVTKVKSFMKDETYPSFKHARGINSRSDLFKCFVGPIFKLIEKEVFKNKFFIKNVPVSERPRVLMEDVYAAGYSYAATDYTAFESLFIAALMEACEFELYDYMTQALSQNHWFMQICEKVLAGENVCHFRDFIVHLLATRMSGEMCTSLGNGFSNLMFMLYVCKINGNTKVVGKVEGDDGIFRMDGPFPTSQLFARLGLNIKMEVHDSINTASFCGIIFDTEDKCNVTDPRKVLATFAWTTKQYACASDKKMKLLLRCKALSLAYQYPGCPIISSLAQYGLRVTRSYDIRGFIRENRSFGHWEREKLLDALRDEKNILIVPPRFGTRMLVEEKFGISVESQIRLEKYLDTKLDMLPIKSEDYIFNFPADWSVYANAYQMSVPIGNSMFYPAVHWQKMQTHIKEW
jgi:hypothetical protein